MMRSTEQFHVELCRTFAGGSMAFVTGNIGDFHVGPEGAIVGFEPVVAYAAAAMGCATVRWTSATGTTQLTPPGRESVRFAGPGPCAELAAALPKLLEELGNAPRPTVLMIDWAAASVGRVGDPLGVVGELLGSAATDPALVRAGHHVVIVDRGGTTTSLLAGLPGVRVVDVPLPDCAERGSFLEHLERVHRSPGLASIAPHETIDRVADAANGMSLRSLHAHMGELRYHGRDLDVDSLLPVKRDFLLRHTEGALRMLDDGRSFDEIAGLHNLKLLVEQHRVAPHEPLRHIVLAGPPGLGKTTAAAATGTAAGRTPVALGETRAQWVGESERRLRLALTTAEAMAPTLMFFDEMDQMLSGDDGPSGDSGVTKRLNAMIWEQTGSVAADVGILFVGATNHPEAMGERVHDRFTVVPVLHPDPTEASEIVRITAARAGRVIDHAAVTAVLRASCTLVSGRTLAELVQNAARFADLHHRRRVEHVDADAVRHAVDDLMPRADTANEELMALQAIRLTRRRSMLPWEAARMRGVAYEVPQYLSRFVDQAGAVDLEALDRRIAEVRRVHG